MAYNRLKGIVCPNMTAFNRLNNKILTYCKNRQGMIAEKWCEPIIHPTDGRIAISAKDMIRDILTDTEKLEVIILTQDWFPPPPQKP